MMGTFSSGARNFNNAADPGEGFSVDPADHLTKVTDVFSSRLRETVQESSDNDHV